MSCATEPDEICFDETINAQDVYGTGKFSEYKEEFERKTGCTTLLGCNSKTKVRRCVDNVEFK